MNRWLPFPLLTLMLLAMWLALVQSLAPAQILLGAVVALVAARSLAALQDPQTLRVRGGLRRLRAMVSLAWLVLGEIVRSNIAVARIALKPNLKGRRSGFVDIPLELRHPLGLAVLSCIITATPGTSWARYDPQQGMLRIHVLDLVDEHEWIGIIQQRYERPLREIFE